MDGWFGIAASSTSSQNRLHLSGLAVHDSCWKAPEMKQLLGPKLHHGTVRPVDKMLRIRPLHPTPRFSYEVRIESIWKKTAPPPRALSWFPRTRRGYERSSSSLNQLTDVVQGRVYCSSSEETSRYDGGDGSGSSEIGSAIGPDEAPLRVGSVAAPARLWVQSVLPKSLWPYAQLARVDKPIGFWLLAWPCFWSACLAAPLGTFPDPKLIGLLSLWAFFMRSATCTVNDILDRDIDGKVERTRSRPFPSGTVTVFQGILFLILETVLGLAVTLPLSNISQILAVVFLPLPAIYPLMKRVTYWPQAFLGLLMSWGSLLGWAVVRGSLDLWAVLPLYASGAFWFLVIDTIYAQQDKHFDKLIGVKSTALLFGDKTQVILTAFSLGSLALLTLTGSNCALGWPFYAGVGVASGHLAWQIFTVNLDDPADCSSKFRSNQWYGAIVCSAILLGKLTASQIT